MKGKVSVIMGLYNTPISYAYEAIDSILNQTYQNFELIICNDGCTDSTFIDVLKKYKDCSKIKFIENEKNSGLAFTLNHCLKYADGEYVARMDSDDISLNNRFAKQVEILDNNPDIDLVNCNVNVFDDSGIYGERKYREYIQKKDFLKNNPIVHPAVMVRKECFDRVSGYRDIPMTYRNEDYDLFMRMFASGVRMYTLQEKVFNFREDINSLKRRKYKFRINEAKVRYYGFKKLKLLPKGFIYVVKPLIIGLLPISIIRLIRKK